MTTFDLSTMFRQNTLWSALLSSMVSRERLQRLGARLAERATTKRVRAIGQVLPLAAIVFTALRARSLWHGSHIDWSNVSHASWRRNRA